MDTAKETGNQFLLDFIQMKFEKDITNWELVSTEDLFDEERDEVIRVFNFNRGIKNNFVIVNPRCYIKGISHKISNSLLVDIHYSLNAVMWSFIRSGCAVFD
jgi:hypothetical protein